MEELALLNYEAIELRDYQTSIAEKVMLRNTLVVLPTGMGKTLISVLVGLQRLEKYPGSKILITSPTRPLNAQHKKSFEKFSYVEPKDIVLITGKTLPNDRAELYKHARIVVATPQCIKNDLMNGLLNLKDFSFITFDEAHRCVKDYAYTYLAKQYMQQAEHPLILGLTASPGGSRERIRDIQNNLFVEAVEIRSESDTDVMPYVKPIEIEWVYVDFPDEFQTVKVQLDDCLKDNLFWLRDHHYLQTLRPSKKALLMLQKRISVIYSRQRNYAVLWGLMRAVTAVKLEYAIELLETQDVSSLAEYLKKISKSKKRSDTLISKNPRFAEIVQSVELLQSRGFRHPKLDRLKSIVTELTKNPEIKIIVFANYRATVENIKNILNAQGMKATIFIGQANKERKGLTQDQQADILKRFKSGEFNVLVATSIGEEGLDVPAVDYVIFYEPVPSEIRTIQRRGRVGRQVAGKTIFLITKNTRDEAYYWTAFHKEQRMKDILYDLKNKKIKPKFEKKKEVEEVKEENKTGLQKWLG